MLLSALGVVAGLALLTVAADQFVIGAARLSAAFRLSPVVIGAVVIGFGTSTPEMLVSGLAAGQGSIDIGVGNIVGSNVVNLTLVLGVAALVTPIVVRSPVLRREAPLSLGAVLLFALLVQGGLTRLEGAILAVAMLAALVIILRSARTDDPQLSAEVADYLADGSPMVRGEVVRTLLGLAGTLGAAQVLVVSANNIADLLGLAEGFIGLTVVAVGTSLPELATALQAARKNETDLIVGNLLGSNLFNSGAVAATAALVGPGPLTDPNLAGLGTYLMVGVGVAATALMVTGRQVVRWEGVLLVAVWLGALPLLAM